MSLGLRSESTRKPPAWNGSTIKSLANANALKKGKITESNMATQIDRLEQNHDKLVAELRTDIKGIKWGMFVVVPGTLNRSHLSDS